MTKTKPVEAVWRTYAKAERVRLYAELKEQQELRAQCKDIVKTLRRRLEMAQLRHLNAHAAVREIGGKLELIDWLEMKEEGH